MARQIPIATARRMLREMLALKEATIVRGVPFGENPHVARQPLPIQMLDAHAEALILLREALEALEAARSAVERSQSQDRARAQALQTRAAGMMRRVASLRSRISPGHSPE